MENFKIDLFEKETGELFPSFQKLNQTDCNICYQHFRKNIKVYDLHESVFDNFNQMVLLLKSIMHLMTTFHY